MLSTNMNHPFSILYIEIVPEVPLDRKVESPS